MNTDTLTVNLRNLRATDSNSLLRMYDQARAITYSTAPQHERAKADKAVQRIVRELQKRKVPL